MAPGHLSLNRECATERLLAPFAPPDDKARVFMATTCSPLSLSAQVGRRVDKMMWMFVTLQPGRRFMLLINVSNEFDESLAAVREKKCFA
ncbi:hypothetical protein F2P81_014255 [Scophthalmus maximus]|uniref:Uncharacterized protein n=1 Tax=Scophthalmus maximus TaxID=52904 RepID=A0A6A4SNC2_SCOMX|nr:hypothetical protein F2P81_014255 [Scophthalmus maximus]